MTRTPRPSNVREEHVQDHVRQLSQLLNLGYYHTTDSRGSDPGFLDTFVIGPGGWLWIECKDATGQTTVEQDLWTAMLRWHGHTVLIIRPADIEPSPHLGGKSLLQVDLERISRTHDRKTWPREIIAGLKLSWNRKARDLARAVARRRRTGGSP